MSKQTLVAAARTALAEGEAVQVVVRLLVLADKASSAEQRLWEIQKGKGWKPRDYVPLPPLEPKAPAKPSRLEDRLTATLRARVL